MAKKPRAHHKKQNKWLMPVMIGLVAALIVLLIVNAFLPKTTTSANTSIMITEDGHVHTTDGQHLGTYEEIFGQSWESVNGTETAAVGAETPAEGAETPVEGADAAPTEAPAAE